MFGSWPGKIFMSAMSSWNFVSSFTLLFERALNVFRIESLSFVISAIGESLIILNASLRDVCIFLTFVAGIARQMLSFVFLCPMSATSAMSDVAYFAEQIRLSAASVDARSMLRCEYVRATGLFRPWRKKARAADV